MRRKEIFYVFFNYNPYLNNHNRFKFLNLFRLKLFTINLIWDII